MSGSAASSLRERRAISAFLIAREHPQGREPQLVWDFRRLHGVVDLVAEHGVLTIGRVIDDAAARDYCSRGT